MWEISVSDLSAAGSSAQGIPSAGVPVPGVGSGGGLSPPPPGVQLILIVFIYKAPGVPRVYVMTISPVKQASLVKLLVTTADAVLPDMVFVAFVDIIATPPTVTAIVIWVPLFAHALTSIELIPQAVSELQYVA